jgi:hypothetical protein
LTIDHDDFIGLTALPGNTVQGIGQKALTVASNDDGADSGGGELG